MKLLLPEVRTDVYIVYSPVSGLNTHKCIYVTQQSNSGLGRLIVEIVRSHTHIHN